MVDKGLVRGIMLTARQQSVCDACHMGKQKRHKRCKKIDRGFKKPNQVVYTHLLIPSKHYGTRYEAFLVIMDGLTLCDNNFVDVEVEHSGQQTSARVHPFG